MAQFLEGDNLNAKLIKLIREADQFLILVSPFISLHQRVKDELLSKRNLNNFKITVVFGKNPDDLERSLGQEDYHFFRGFPDCEIRYSEHLHAKFYCSEDAALITSLNLYEYSHVNNIEAGVLLLAPDANTRCSDFGFQSDDLAYSEALSYFKSVIQRSDLIIDQGYCIRTGVSIPYDTNRPMSFHAYQSWAQFGNPDYPEKYCHKTGRPSGGRTSMRFPVLHH